MGTGPGRSPWCKTEVVYNRSVLVVRRSVDDARPRCLVDEDHMIQGGYLCQADAATRVAWICGRGLLGRDVGASVGEGLDAQR